MRLEQINISPSGLTLLQRCMRVYKDDNRTVIKVLVEDNTLPGAWHWAARTVYADGRVIYSVSFGVIVNGQEPIMYKVQSRTSMHQAVFYKHHVMQLLKMARNEVGLRMICPFKVLNDGVRLVDTSGMEDAEFYSDDEHEMYGYGLPMMTKR